MQGTHNGQDVAASTQRGTISDAGSPGKVVGRWRARAIRVLIRKASRRVGVANIAGADNAAGRYA